ncbi:MAG: YwaF family protein [Prevotella sp.]|nr:YwaF family protein [Staphylococcus sp.]MCM1350811.1 YwaF family protein [Prevotella sp.]
MKTRKLIFERIIPFFFMALFTFRLFCYQQTIGGYVGLDTSPLANKGLTIICLLAIWFNFVAILIILMRPFFHFKTAKNLARFACLPIHILNLVLALPISQLLCGKTGIHLLSIVYMLEAIIGIIESIYYLIIDRGMKTRAQDIFQMLGIFVLLLIACLPSYLPQFMLGEAKASIVVKDISFAHRILIYIGIIVPFVLYFTLRNQREEVIRFSLIFISIATMVGFLVNFNYTNFLEPWTWPFHLCNTAMFIIPICLIFKRKRLFYFTYFINVMGALIAMLMPNYPDSVNLFSMRIFNFWYNHWIAFFMPILLVALKQFKRPTLKEFKWSMIWFFGYFFLVLVLNVVFSAKGHPVDYFFINSDYVADKLGTWAEKIFNLSTTIHIAGLELEFHPLYQLVFFLVYVALGLGVWFIYGEFFRIADSHYELHMKLRAIRLHEYAALCAGIGKENKMNESIEAKMELKHFSKKYATSKVYAVKDANLEVHAGEIFGFLGPNGAGKSTIIKSTVGIQPITEGAIEICGYDVATSPVDAKSNIGYVPDHYALYEKLTGREYINYIADIYNVSEEDRNTRIEKYIQIFELQGSIDSKIKTYSHGMKQKITIMSALVHNPKVWILDEPLTGLDPTSIYQVKECMKQHAAEGNIVFFSSHLIDIVEKLCGRIAIIKKGQIQCIKTLEEIESSGTTLEQFYLDTIESHEE